MGLPPVTQNGWIGSLKSTRMGKGTAVGGMGVSVGGCVGSAVSVILGVEVTVRGVESSGTGVSVVTGRRGVVKRFQIMPNTTVQARQMNAPMTIGSARFRGWGRVFIRVR